MDFPSLQPWSGVRPPSCLAPVLRSPPFAGASGSGSCACRGAWQGRSLPPTPQHTLRQRWMSRQSLRPPSQVTLRLRRNALLNPVEPKTKKGAGLVVLLPFIPLSRAASLRVGRMARCRGSVLLRLTSLVLFDRSVPGAWCWRWCRRGRGGRGLFDLHLGDGAGHWRFFRCGFTNTCFCRFLSCRAVLSLACGLLRCRTALAGRCGFSYRAHVSPPLSLHYFYCN